MAQNFKRLILSEVGTTAADLPDGADFPTGFHTVIGINLANISSNMILGTVYIEDSSTTPNTKSHIVKDAAIPSGSSISISGKYVVTGNDRLYFQSDTAASMDVVVSYVQEIST